MPQTHGGPLGGCPAILMPRPLPVWSVDGKNSPKRQELWAVCFICLRPWGCLDSGATNQVTHWGLWLVWSENTFIQGFTWVWFQGSWKFCLLSKLSNQNVYYLLRFCFWDSVSFLREGTVFFLWFLSAMTKLLVWPYTWEEEWYRKGQGVRDKKKTKDILWNTVEAFPKSCALGQTHWMGPEKQNEKTHKVWRHSLRSQNWSQKLSSLKCEDRILSPSPTFCQRRSYALYFTDFINN